MKYVEIDAADIPMQLLLEADPCERNIQSYLNDSWCFVGILDGNIVGACVAKLIHDGCAEIYNVAVWPAYQQQGIGSDMLQFTVAELAKKNVQRIELGTGTFGYQLTYYQKMGFRVDAVIKDHFLTHYAEPIFENGIQHKDMLRLYIDL